MGEAEAGYIRQSLEAEHVIQLSLLEQASDTWFTQDVQMGFEKAGDDTYFPVFETMQEAED
jgi:hypothetical protein